MSAKKTPDKKAPKENKPKPPKLYRVVRFESLKTDSEKAKKILASETQSAVILRALAKSARTFEELIEEISPKLKGKKESTLKNNARWYLSALRSLGLVKSTVTKEPR